MEYKPIVFNQAPYLISKIEYAVEIKQKSFFLINCVFLSLFIS